MPSTPPPAPAGPSAELADQAVALAERWVIESADTEVDRSAQRLASVLKDPHGLPFTIGFVDGVMRPESLSAAASALLLRSEWPSVPRAGEFDRTGGRAATASIRTLP